MLILGAVMLRRRKQNII
ncbi:hypothetical protein ACFL1G_01595 [Planctomycetota bacterium]